jgi:hypothetical protein
MHPIKEKIKSRGHWKIVIRPSAFMQYQISELSRCKTLIRDNKVQLRGWDYPHYDTNTEINTGLDYVEQFSEFLDRIEAWRFYQSGQFIQYKALWEDWFEARTTIGRQQQSLPNESLSIFGTVFLLTEIYEFASRLGAKGILGESCEIQITLFNTMNRKLKTFDSSRHLFADYKTTISTIPHSVSLRTTDLIGRSAELSLEHSIWLFQRFNWDIKPETLKEDQMKLLEKRL